MSVFFNFNRFTKGSFGPQYRNSSPILTKASISNIYGQNFNLNRFNAPTDDLTSDSILEQWLPTTPVLLHKLFRVIHRFDSVAGPAVDLISIMPFSAATLVGINDKRILDIYQQSLDELHIETLLPDIAAEFLVIGRVIGSLLFDDVRGIWTDIIIQDPDYCEITNIPLRGHDPKIDLKVSENLKQFLRSQDPRDIEARKEMPKNFVKQLLSQDIIPLDPISTLYIPRQTTPYDFMGSSIYNRILAFWALEKTLLNGTLVAAKRRQRSILHVTVGETDLWEPDEEDISTIAGMFMQADEDPVGAIVATRLGVETNEVRSGMDFWRLSDEWDFLSTAKMRALGINESFLCITGDTLIATEKGLQRIDQMKNSGDKDIQPISTKVLSKNNKEGTAVKWIYRGISDIQETITYNGRLLKSTKEHKVLVLENGELIWKEAGCLKQGDNLCISTLPYTRKTKLELNLPIWEDKKHITCTRKPRAPQYMTPKLAYLLGLIVSEGSHGNRVSFSNSRIELLDKYAQLMLDLFDLQTKREFSAKKEDMCTIKGTTVCTANTYSEKVKSTVLNSWLKYLGLYTGKSIKGKTPSYFKVIPWCILQADEESQLAYLAAYLEGDGSLVAKKGITFFSASKTNLRMIQSLLGSHGILSRVSKNYPAVILDKRSSSILYKKIKKYLVSKTTTPDYIESKIHRNGTYEGRKFGLPTEGLRTLLRSRKQKTTSLGAWFLNDNEKSVFISKWEVIDRSEGCQYLLYESYQEGVYSEFLEALKIISKTAYENIIKLLELKYFYDKVYETREGEKQAVYDLTMSVDDVPAFVAESIVIHNSGDATYNTMEVALSVFVESLRDFRAGLVNKIFYEKLFPTLAEIHGFKKRTQAELDHHIRIGRLPDYQKTAEGTIDNNLITPQLSFHKQLRPEADAAYLDILGIMEEKGIPIPLRTWASAGGLDLESIMNMKDEDIQNRKEVSGWLKAVRSEEGEESSNSWGSVRTNITSSLKGALDTLPVWLQDKFLNIRKDTFLSILKASDPVKQLQAKYKNDPQKVAGGNYILHRLGIYSLPFDISAVKDIADHLKKCASTFSNKSVNGEFMALNKIIRKASNRTKNTLDKQLPSINKDKNLYLGMKSPKNNFFTHS